MSLYSTLDVYIYIYIYTSRESTNYIVLYSTMYPVYHMLYTTYAQILIVDNSAVVNVFSFLKITQLHDLGSGRNLVQMILTGLPELFEHDISYKNSRGDENTTF